MTLEARLGVSPFDVLHQGLARKTGLSFGTVIFAFGIGPVAHFFFDRFHLGVPAGTDLGPGVAAE